MLRLKRSLSININKNAHNVLWMDFNVLVFKLYIANEKLEYQHIKIHPKNVVCIFVDVDGKTSLEAQHAILEEARKHSVQDCLVTLRIAGTLSTGSASEINLRMILAELKDAYHVLV